MANNDERGRTVSVWIPADLMAWLQQHPDVNLSKAAQQGIRAKKRQLERVGEKAS